MKASEIKPGMLFWKMRVISRVGPMVNVQCQSCGVRKKVSPYDLQAGKVRSCGRSGCRQKKLNPHCFGVGSQIHRLTVIDLLEYSSHAEHRMYKCLCACGREIAISEKNLKHYTKSCGCLVSDNGKSRRKYDDSWIGMRFGRLVIDRVECIGSKTRFICKCDCGKTKNISATSLCRGTTKSCGCIRLELMYAKNSMPIGSVTFWNGKEFVKVSGKTAERIGRQTTNPDQAGDCWVRMDYYRLYKQEGRTLRKHEKIRGGTLMDMNELSEIVTCTKCGKEMLRTRSHALRSSRAFCGSCWRGTVNLSFKSHENWKSIAAMRINGATIAAVSKAFNCSEYIVKKAVKAWHQQSVSNAP